ncbi:MAG: hypothetical protein IPN79_12865 [Saprospiraceae bacterium]|nr:hypothetical protein [Saprospiraceae bacterium]
MFLILRILILSFLFYKIEAQPPLTSLSQKSNHFISTDSYGLTWISSVDGVNVFNGNDVRVYRPGTYNMIGSNIQSSFFEDCNHNVWFSTYNAMHKYERHRDDFKVFQFRDTIGKVITDSYKVIAYSNGFVFLRFGDYIGIVDINTDVLFRYFHLSLMNDRYFDVLFKGEDLHIINSDNFNIHLITWNKCLSKKPTKTILLSENNLTNVLWKDQNTILYSQSATNVVQQYNLNNKTSSPFYTHATPIRHMAYDANSRLLVVEDGYTAYLVNPELQDVISTHPWPPSLEGNSSPINIQGDIIWQGVDGKGIRYFHKNKQKFRHHRLVKDGRPANARSIVRTNDRTYWYGSRDYGIGRFDIFGNHLDHFHQKNNKSPSDFVLQLLPLSDGSLLATGGEKLSLYHKKRDAFLSLQQKNSNQPFFIGTVATLSDSLIFCINYNDFQNLYQISLFPDNAFVLKPVPVLGTQKKDEVVHVFSAFSNNLILNINTTDVALVTYENKSFHIRKRYNINVSVNHVLPHGDSLYLSTSNGLFITDKNMSAKPVKITDKTNLLSQNIYCTLAHQNEIFLSTNNGLMSYSKETNTSHVFSLSDGIQDLEYNSTAAFKNEDGTMFFGGINGINIFHPDSINFLQKPALIHFSEILINDEKDPRCVHANGLQELSLDYTDNTVTFRFNGIDYADPTTIRLRYKLVDYDKNEIESDNQNGLVRYANLPPGEYTFLVYATNSEGIWNEEARKLKINIKPPFWLTWWFRLLVVLVAIGSGYGIVRSFYKRKIEKKNQLLREQSLIIEKQIAIEAERTRIATEMHDDLGSGLTKIRYLSERALKNTSDPDEIAQIKNIADQSNTLVSNMSEIIWALNSRFDTTENLIGYLRRYIVEYLEDHHIPHQLVTNHEHEDIPVTGEKRRNVFSPERNSAQQCQICKSRKNRNHFFDR